MSSSKKVQQGLFQQGSFKKFSFKIVSFKEGIAGQDALHLVGTLFEKFANIIHRVTRTKSHGN